MADQPEPEVNVAGRDRGLVVTSCSPRSIGSSSSGCGGCVEPSDPASTPALSSTNTITNDPLQEGLRREVEVAVIGNGPSAIFLSLLLSGYCPYFKGDHPEPYLCRKLRENLGKSILELDLEWLSDGLEGRSNNPVALLVDALLRPDADMGESLPSSLCWVRDPTKAVPHVVVGRGNPGGCWQYMEPSTRTLSLAEWLDLPLYSFQDWQRDHGGGVAANRGKGVAGNKDDSVAGNKDEGVTGSKGGVAGSTGEVTGSREDAAESKKCVGKSRDEGVAGKGKEDVAGNVTEAAGTEDESMEVSEDVDDSFSKRALSGQIAAYYADYVTKMGLQKNFVSNTEVCCAMSLEEKVLDVPCCGSVSDCPSPQSIPSPASPTGSSPSSSSSSCVDMPISWEKASLQLSNLEDCGVFGCDNRCEIFKKYKWCLQGNQSLHTNGKTSSSKVCVFSQKLVLACGISGKSRHVGVNGEDADFIYHSLPKFSMRLQSCNESETALVVGDGLSAADAVMLALKRGLKVVHVFQKDPFDKNLIFSKMPDTVYPDYKHIHRLMQGKTVDPRYHGFAKSRISEFQKNGFTVVTATGEEVQREDVAVGCVLLGTNAELSFLPDDIISKLAVKPDQPINAKHNPTNVNQISFVSDASSSLYAVGSLTGDNFVRFGVGSALGAAQHIIKNTS